MNRDETGMEIILKSAHNPLPRCTCVCEESGEGAGGEE